MSENVRDQVAPDTFSQRSDITKKSIHSLLGHEELTNKTEENVIKKWELVCK